MAQCLTVFSSAFIILLTSSFTKGQQDFDCINPKSELGNCIKLLDCPHLLKIIKARPIVRNDVKFLQKSTCGFAGQHPKVCCVPPGSHKGNNDTTTTSTTSTSTPKPTTTTTTKATPAPALPSSSVPNLGITLNFNESIRSALTHHPNLHLLPTLKTCGQSVSTDRIIGGKDAGLGAYPWMVLLAFKEDGEDPQLACGGTLISDRYILTAAHCVRHLPSGFKLNFIRLGEYDQTLSVDCDDNLCADPVQDVGIEEVIHHPGYDLKKKKENDIALIRLNHTAKLGPFVSPICLPCWIEMDTSARSTIAGNITKLVVAGWGRTVVGSENGANILQELTVPIISKQECNSYYTNRVRLGPIDESRFCAGGEADKDSCQGDSGGPLQQSVPIPSLHNSLRSFQFGVVSMGPARCGSKDQPALYTKVSHYMVWILDNLKP